MSRRKNTTINPDTQEDEMTTTEDTELETGAENEEELPETDEVDLDVEDVEDTSEGESEETDEPKAEKAPAKPKRGDLPEGLVTPIQFAKILGERRLHTDRDGNVVDEVKPQMVYSYMKNSPKDDRLEPHDVQDSNGVTRSVLNLEEALAWWVRKNERAAQRKANAKAKEEKKANASKTSNQALVETGEAGPEILESETAEEAE